MAFPVLYFGNGKHLTCNTPPEIVPCLLPEYGCFTSASNCWGGIVSLTNGSGGIIPGGYCTSLICPIATYKQAHFNYIPSLPGNAFFAALFAVLLFVQIGFAVRTKTWSFLIGMFGGLALEVIGYIGRIMMHNRPFKKDVFLLYLICLTIGPAFLCASIYLCLGRIIVVYNESLCRIKPRTVTIIFIFCDFFSLVLQAVGGALASLANSSSQLNTGTHIMVAGLSFQVFSLLLFITLAGEFFIKVRLSNAGFNPAFEELRAENAFKIFIHVLPITTLCIFIRCVYRVAELSKGFDGTLFRNEQVTFMILEGTMISVATIALTVGHPGFALRGVWKGLTKGWKGGGEGALELSEESVVGKK